MASPFDPIRKALPDFKDTSDEEIINDMSEKLGMSTQDVAEYFGLPTGRQRGALSAGLRTGIDQLQGLGYSALGATADIFGAKQTRDWANKQAKIQGISAELEGRPDLQRVEDVWDKPSKWLPFLGYQAASQVPQVAGAIGTGLLVPEVAIPAWAARGAAALPGWMGGGALAGRTAAAGVVPGAQFAARRAALEKGMGLSKQLVGGAAFNAGQSVGSLYQEAVEAGRPEASGEAFLKAIPYGIAETLPEAVLGANILHGSGMKGGMLKRMAKSAAVQGPSGATSEYLQGKLEQSMHPDYGPGSLTPEQIRSQDINNPVIGGLVEGLFGLAGGVRNQRLATRQPTNLLPTAKDSETGASLQDRINQVVGINPPMTPAQRAQYEKELIAAYNAPIGQPPVGGTMPVATSPLQFGEGDQARTLHVPTQGIYAEPLLTRGEELAAQAGYTPLQGLATTDTPKAAPAAAKVKGAGTVPGQQAVDIGKAAAAAAGATSTGTIDPVQAQIRDTKAALMPHFLDTLPADHGKSPGQLHNMLTRLVGDPKTEEEAVATLQAKIKANLEGTGNKKDRLRRIEQALIMLYNIKGITAEDERESADDVFTRFEASKVAAKPAATVTPAGTTPAGTAAAAPTEVEHAVVHADGTVGKLTIKRDAAGQVLERGGVTMQHTPKGKDYTVTSVAVPEHVKGKTDEQIVNTAFPEWKPAAAGPAAGPAAVPPPTAPPAAGAATPEQEAALAKLRDHVATGEAPTAPPVAAAPPVATTTPPAATAPTTTTPPKKTVVDVTPTVKTAPAPVVNEAAPITDPKELRKRVLDKLETETSDKLKKRNRKLNERVLDMEQTKETAGKIADDLGVKVDPSRIRQIKMLAKKAKAAVLAEAGIDPNSELAKRVWEYGGEDVEHKTAEEQGEDYAAHLEEEDQPGKLGEAGILAQQEDAALVAGKVTAKSGAERNVSDVSEHGRLTDKQRDDIYDEQAIAKLSEETLNKLYLELVEAKPSNKQKLGIANIAAELVRREQAGLFSKRAAKAEKEHKQNESGAKKSEGESGSGKTGAADSGAGHKGAEGTSDSAKKAAGKIAAATKVIPKGKKRVPQPVRAQRSPAEAPTSTETTQERAERNWGLAQVVADTVGVELGSWDKQTPRVQLEFARLRGNDQNFSDAVRIKEQYGPKPEAAKEKVPVKEEAPAIPDAVVEEAPPSVQAEAVQTEVEKLEEPEVARLEEALGAKRDTPAFLDGVVENVTNWVNGAKEKVAASIRSIINRIAAGLMSVMVIFNPMALNTKASYNLPEAVIASHSVTVDIKAKVPAAARAKMSPMAQRVYEAMAPQAKEKGKGFAIADKPDGMLHLFHADGTLIAQIPALYGKDIGDTITGNPFLGETKITPAGTFDLEYSPPYIPTDYANALLGLKDTGAPEGIMVAIHPLALSRPAERRAERLASPDPKDNRISYGCINTSEEAFVKTIVANIKELDGGFVSVLPDEVSKTEAMFPFKTKTTTVATRAMPGQATAADEREGAFGRPEKTTATTRTAATRSKYTKIVAWARNEFGDRVAPNGKPVWENFVRWFGDSKIVDEQGNPLRVFHGTNALEDFSVFKRGWLYRLSTGVGFHFAEDPKVASRFAGETGYDAFRSMEYGRVLPVYIRMENPLRITDHTGGDDTAVSRAILEHSMTPEFLHMMLNNAGYPFNLDGARGIMKRWDAGKEVSFGQRQLSRKEFIEQFARASVSSRSENEKIVKDMLKKFIAESGYDGIIYTNTSTRETAGASNKTAYVAFHPEQVKSASGNFGNFSLEEGDIQQSVKQGLPLLHEHHHAAAAARIGAVPIGTFGPIRNAWASYYMGHNRNIHAIRIYDGHLIVYDGLKPSKAVVEDFWLKLSEDGTKVEVHTEGVHGASSGVLSKYKDQIEKVRSVVPDSRGTRWYYKFKEKSFPEGDIRRALRTLRDSAQEHVSRAFDNLKQVHIVRGTGAKAGQPGHTYTKKMFMQFSQREAEAEEDTYTVDELHKEITEFIKAENRGILQIVPNVDAIPEDIRNRGKIKPGTQAITIDGKVWMIADRIDKGTGRAVFMHEVGSHLGIQRMLASKDFQALVAEINRWAARNDGSIESELAKRALARVAAAGVTSERRVANETMAYFIEEAINAGIDPKALDYKTDIGRWFRKMWSLFKQAVQAIGVDVSTVTPQDIINLAYGAARLQMASQYHGTAVTFPSFDNRYINTGEGNQTYGWGHYLAQARGAGHAYMTADTRRRGGAGNLMRVDTNVQAHELLDWDKKWGEQSPLVQAAFKSLPNMSYNFDALRGDMTGENLYMSLVKSEGGDKKKASEKLESLGIKGVRYMDEFSRNAALNPDITHYVARKMEDGRYWGVYAVSKNGRWDRRSKFIGKTDAELEAKRMDASIKNPTHNMVVFNGNDIQVVHTEPGGRPVGDTGEGQSTRSGKDFYDRATELMKGITTLSPEYEERVAYDLKKNARPLNEYEQQWEKYMNKEWTPSDAERNRLMEVVKVGFIREVPREYWHDQKAYEAYLRNDYRRSMASDAVRAEDEAAQRRKEASGQYAASTRAALQQLEQDGAALAKALGIPVDKFWAAASVGDKSLLRGTVDRAAEMLRKRNLLRDQLEGQQSFVGVRAKNLTAQMRTAMVQAATRKIPRHLTSEEVRRLEYQVTRIVVDANRDPRIEISDKDAKLNLPYGPTKARKYKLSDVLHHPLLYAAYPELKDVPVEIRVDKAITNDQVTASYILDDKRIVMNLPAATRRQADNRGNLQVLLHEVQHWIQQHEGYARGSSPVYYDISHQGNNLELFREVVENWMYVKDKLAATTHPAERKRLIKVRNSLARMQDTLIRLSEITPKEMAKLEDTTTMAMHIIAQYTVAKEQAGKNPTRAEKGRLKEHLELAKQAVEEHEDAFHAVMENHGVNLDGLNDVARQYYIRTGGEKEAFDIMKRHDADLAGEEKGWPALLRTDFAVTSADEIDVALPKYLHDALEDRFGESNEYIPVDEGEQSVRAERAFDALPVPMRKPVRSIWTSIKTAAKNGMLAGAITEDLADIAAKGGMLSVGKFVEANKIRNAERMANEMAIEEVLKLYDTLPQSERGEDKGSVNLFIHDSTISGKWGYKIDPESNWTIDPDMAARFKALSKEGQQLVRAVFKHGHDMLLAKQQVVRDAINADYVERAAEETDPKKLAKLQRELASRLMHFNKLLALKGEGPYAPLKRFGKYVAIGMSQAYVDAKENGDQAEMNRLIAEGNHYHVEFADTQAQADDLAEDLRPHFKEVEAFAKESPDAYLYANHDMFLAFAKMRRMLEEQFGDTKAATDTYKHMDKMLRDMYLSTLAESSARKSELHRRGVAGADKDMLRAFATQGRADAHFLASAKHNDKILDALQAMRDEAKTNRRQNMPYFNEMLLRHGASLEYRPHRVEDVIRRATSVWMLATSPAFYLQQLTQTYMMSLPVIAGRQGYFRTEQNLRRAYGDLLSLVTGTNLTEHIDWSKAPADVRDMLQTLTRNGKIDIGIDVETGSWATQGSGVASKAWNKVDRVLRGINVRVESFNRATAAIASYRMELARQLKLGTAPADAKAAATKYAEAMVHQTHGSYDGFNTPRLLSSAFPGARTITQFRRFQIIQLSLIARLAHNAFAGENADVRAVGRKALAYTLGHTAVMGGLMGMPGAAAIMWILNKLFRDPDDPEDIQLKIRRAIGDKTLSDLLLNGAPAAAGVNLSGKLGMGQVLSLLPFTNIDFSRKGYYEMLAGVMGPFVGGLVPRAMDGIALISKGEYYKGVENLLPNGFGNAMKGLRFATDGVTMRNGDVVIPPDQITMFDATMQGLGLPTTTITDRTALQQNKYEFDTFYHDRESQLKNDYIRAYEANDSAAMQDVRNDWMAMQESRVRNGYKREPMSTLLRAPMQQRKRERHVEGGVEWTKSNRHFVEERARI